MPPNATRSIQGGNTWGRISQSWREALSFLALACLALFALAMREWGEMAHQWWNIDTYTHILIVPFIIAWLTKLKFEELAKISPNHWLPGLGLVAAGLGLWLLGRATGINLIAHAGAVGAIQGAVVTALGIRASAILAMPIFFAVFLVPFGDEIIAPLQTVTAEIAIALTHWSGIPAEIDGIYIDTPIGLFIVAEACSGVRFLIAMVTLAVLVCFTRFEDWTRRLLFLAASIVVPILANGVRAWGTIYVAQSEGIEFAEGFDHIVYGWIFFALVVSVLLAAAWRFFEREPENYGWSADQLSEIKAVSWLETTPGNRFVAVAAMAAIVFAGVVASAIVAPGLIG